MKRIIRKLVGILVSMFIYELKFFGRVMFRLLELFGQLFPEDSRGCKIRGQIYRPFLKKCGKNFQVGLYAKLEHLNNIEVADNVYIGHGCWISGIRGGIKFEDEVMLGPFVKMVSSNHTHINKSFRFGPGVGDGIFIGRGTWIASNAVITAGVKLGDCCLVAAGAVVTRDFDSFSIIGGIPAREIGKIDE